MKSDAGTAKGLQDRGNDISIVREGWQVCLIPMSKDSLLKI